MIFISNSPTLVLKLLKLNISGMKKITIYLIVFFITLLSSFIWYSFKMDSINNRITNCVGIATLTTVIFGLIDFYIVKTKNKIWTKAKIGFCPYFYLLTSIRSITARASSVVFVCIKSFLAAEAPFIPRT